MKPNLGLSIVIGVLFSIFVTSIYILMSTVPALIGQGPQPANPLGDAISVFLVLSFLFSFIMHEWQRTLEEFNKRNRRDDEDKKDTGSHTGDDDTKR